MKKKIEFLISHIFKHRYVYILIGIFLLLNIRVLIQLAADWMIDDNYSHGFLVIPISFVLLYLKRKEIELPAKSSSKGLIMLIVGGIGLIIGNLAIEYFTIRISYVLVLTGIALYYLGEKNFRKVWFPFAFLLFMIPIPAIIYYSSTLPMQIFASKATNMLLHLIGVSSVRQGNIIFLPNYTLEVVEACSGLRSLVTLMALSALYGYIFLNGKLKPVILFLSAIPIAIITNIIRLLVSSIGAYSISGEFADGFLHDVSGILVFFTALGLTILLGSFLQWLEKRS